jgi:hypothetical protein
LIGRGRESKKAGAGLGHGPNKRNGAAGHDVSGLPVRGRVSVGTRPGIPKRCKSGPVHVRPGRSAEKKKVEKALESRMEDTQGPFTFIRWDLNSKGPHLSHSSPLSVAAFPGRPPTEHSENDKRNLGEVSHISGRRNAGSGHSKGTGKGRGTSSAEHLVIGWSRSRKTGGASSVRYLTDRTA